MRGIFVFVKTPNTSTSTPNSSKNNKYPICHQNPENRRPPPKRKRKRLIVKHIENARPRKRSIQSGMIQKIGQSSGD